MRPDRINELTRAYEESFAERGNITPGDPLEFHLYHLARYWSRLVGFCRHDPSSAESLVESDLGACVQLGSEFANAQIDPNCSIYKQWRKCWGGRRLFCTTGR